MRDPDSEQVRKACSAAPSGSKPKQSEEIGEARGAAFPGTHIGREALDKDALWTRRVTTAELAHPQPNAHLASCAWNVDNGTRVGTVDVR